MKKLLKRLRDFGASFVSASSHRRKPGRPRTEDRHKTIEAQKPWDRMGISRRTWFRRRERKRRKAEAST